MRYRFAREGIQTKSGHFLEPEALVWEEKPILVVWGNDFSWPDNILGKATDLRREEDGWLTAEIEWTTEKGKQAEKLIDRDIFLTVYCNKILPDTWVEGPVRHVEKANLLSIFTTLEDTWVRK